MKIYPFWLLMIIIVMLTNCGAAKESMKEIPASLISSKIISGQEVNIDNAIIQGNLSPKDSGENKQIVINHPIKITNSVIAGKINFNGCEFKNELSLENTSITEGVYFESSIFNQLADFNKTKFNKSAIFSDAKFMDRAYFESSIFNELADFKKTQFDKSAIFSDAKFMDRAYFDSAKFLDSRSMADFSNVYFDKVTEFQSSNFEMATFQNSKFNDNVSFRGATFNGSSSPINFHNSIFKKDADFALSTFPGANFDGAKFERSVNFARSIFKGDFIFITPYELPGNDNPFILPRAVRFNDCIFLGIAMFPSSIFLEESTFEHSQFHKDAYFNNCKFNKTVKFSGCKFEGDVSFNESRFFDDAIFDDACFEKDIYLIRTKYDRFYIRWKSISDKGRLGYNETAYQLLIDDFKRLGFIEDANDCYYSFMVNRFLHNQPPTTSARLWLESSANASSNSIYGFGKSILNTRNWLGRLASSVSWNWTQTNYQISGAQGWIGNTFIWIIDYFLWHLNGYGKKPANALLWSIGLIIFFTFIWIGYSLMKPKDVDEYIPSNSESSIFRLLIDGFRFSSTLFLSGTKLFVDPPELPEKKGKMYGFKVIYYAERILGALFSFLFFVAVTGMIIR
jgi:uncharacterized protein YjbI with pentapeptide repeats